MVDAEPPPGLAVAVHPVGSHRLDDLANELIAELLVAPIPVNAESDGALHVATNGLAVELGQALDRAEPLAGQPEPEHFSDLEHTDLPERHRRLPDPADRNAARVRSAAPALVDPRDVVP